MLSAPQYEHAHIAWTCFRSTAVDFLLRFAKGCLITSSTIPVASMSTSYGQNNDCISGMIARRIASGIMKLPPRMIRVIEGTSRPTDIFLSLMIAFSSGDSWGTSLPQEGQ